MTYAEKLRDPRWQKKRLKVMERDGFACRKCSDTTKTLHVHHNYYLPDSAPWEYMDSALFTVCDDCHAEEEAGKKHLDELIALLLRQGGALNTDVHALSVLINDITDQGENAAGIPLIRNSLEELWTSLKERRK